MTKTLDHGMATSMEQAKQRGCCVSTLGSRSCSRQWGAWAPVGPDAGASHPIFDYVTDDNRCQVIDEVGRLRGRPWPGWHIQDGTRDGAVMRRYGKHHAGRLLDGRTWDAYPGQVSH